MRTARPLSAAARHGPPRANPRSIPLEGAEPAMTARRRGEGGQTPVSQPQAPIRQRGRKGIVKVQAFLVSGEFRVHRAGCEDTAREARRSDSAGHPEEYASKAAVIRALWADIIAEDPDTYGTPGGIAAWKPRPGSWPAPGGCPVNNPVPAPGPGVPAGGTGIPRGEGDGIAVEVPTRAGLVTVVFTGREHARACPPGAPSPTGTAGTPAACTWRPGLAGHRAAGAVAVPGRRPAGPAVAGAIPSIIGAGFAAWLRDHPEILDVAGQARARAGGPGRGATWNC